MSYVLHKLLYECFNDCHFIIVLLKIKPSIQHQIFILKIL